MFQVEGICITLLNVNCYFMKQINVDKVKYFRYELIAII